MTQPSNHPTTQPPNHPTTQPPNLAVFLLLVLFALLIFSIRDKSPTLDEQNHIARGLAYLKTGDLRLSQEHPPLINLWEAWPLWFDPAVRLPLDSPSWANAEWYGFADRLLWHVNDGPTRERMVFAARVSVMWLTLILAALVYRGGKEMGGAWAGLLAMAMLVFDPNILAHGRLATNDMGLTCLSVAAIVGLGQALRSPGSALRWAMAGLALGLALVSKFSALVLGPVSLIIVFLAYFEQCLSNKKMLSVWPWSGRLALLYGVAGLTVWAVYGLQWGPIALLGGLPGPAPSYFAGVQAILRRTGSGSPAFLMGQLSSRGWWYYFPVAFAIKTPLPTLLLLALALILTVKSQLTSRLTQLTTRNLQLVTLLTPTLFFWLMALTGGFNIGYRHILPSLPFLFILAADQIVRHTDLTQKKRWLVLVSVLAVCLLILTTLDIAPNYLAFFNKLIGGADNGYKFLVDSNLDWGQDLPGLAKWVKQHNVQRINLSWFGAAHPEAYGFDFHPLPGFWRFGGDPAAYGLNPLAPAPGTYAISASNVQGIKLDDPDTYAWFRQRSPDDHIGHSILIYHVIGETPSRALVLAVPTAQLADAERAWLAGGAQVRRFDPSTGLIVPAAEDVRYVLPTPPDWGETVREGPGYVVVRGTPPLHPSTPSAQFGTWVELRYHQVEIGSQSGPKERAISVYVEWTVIEAPHRAATSFAHLLDAGGRYLTGWDGLSAPATCWQPGDVIAQTYSIPLPADLPPGPYQIELGWYDAETVQRWPCLVNGQPTGDRFLINIEIQP